MNRAGISHDGLLRVTHQAPVGAQTLATHYSVSLPVMLAKMLKSPTTSTPIPSSKPWGVTTTTSRAAIAAAPWRCAHPDQARRDRATPPWPTAPASPPTISSARQMLSVLNFIQKNDAELDFIKLLPSSQVDGTLAWRRSVTAPHDEEQGTRQDRYHHGYVNLASFIDTPVSI